MSLGLAIVGCGKMGRMCEALAPEYGFEVRARFSGANNADGVGLTREALRGVDAAGECGGGGCVGGWIVFGGGFFCFKKAGGVGGICLRNSASTRRGDGRFTT